MAAAETPTSPAPAGTEPDHFMATLPPCEVSEALRPRIDELDLWGCVADLRDRGYAVVEDAAPPALLDELRARRRASRPRCSSGAIRWWTAS